MLCLQCFRHYCLCNLRCKQDIPVLQASQAPMQTWSNLWLIQHVMWWLCSEANAERSGKIRIHLYKGDYYRYHHTTILRPFLRDHPEENFWTLWCKGRLTEADTLTIRLGATPSRLSNAHLHHPPFFYRPDALPAAQPTVSKHWRQLVHSV